MPISSEPVPYLFAVFDADTGRLTFGPAANGGRAKEFASNTDGCLVRWKVEQAKEHHGRGYPWIGWPDAD